MDTTFDALADNTRREIVAVFLSLLILGLIFLGGSVSWTEGYYFSFVALVFIYGALLFERGFTAYHTYSFFRDTPTSTARSVAMGPVELRGTVVVGDETISTPFSGDDCVAHRYAVWEKNQYDDRAEWRLQIAGGDNSPFRLEDDTGSIQVDPDFFRLDFEAHETVIPAHQVPPIDTEELSPLLNDVKDELLQPSENQRKFVEYVLQPGEDVYIFGKATRQNDAMITNNDHGPSIITDKDMKAAVSQLRNDIGLRIVAGIVLLTGSTAMLLTLADLLTVTF